MSVPKNVKGGPFEIFLASILLQNIETNDGGTLWCNPKIFKKSLIVPKKISGKKQDSQRGILSMFARFWASVLLFIFVLDELLRFECFEPPKFKLLNNEVDLTRLKNYPL